MASPSIEIRPMSGTAGLRAFVRYPFGLYAGDPHWVPPLIAGEIRSLDPGRNPVFEHGEARYWIACRGGEAVGRVAAFLSPRDNARRGTRIARFGYLDFIDDRAVVEALLSRVERWAGERGMEAIEGPQGAGHFDRNGVQVEGFGTLPTAVSAHNFPYYAAHLEALGLRKAVDYLEHRIRLDLPPPERLSRIAEAVLRRKGFSLWQAGSRRELRTRGREVFALVNAAYVGLHDFVPVSPRESDFLIGQFFSYLDPRFVKIVVDAGNRIVAFAAAMPSFSRALQVARGRLWPLGWWRMLREMRKSPTLDLYLVAVAPELRGSGLNALVLHAMHRAAADAGFAWGETTGELETNARVLAMWENYECTVIRRRRIYAKVLAS